MPFQYEEPTIEISDARPGHEETIERHPSYALIGASRVTGQTFLYGTDFEHAHYVTISIRKSELHRRLSQDWHFGREEYIEVALSEAQWATFVSSMNVGQGVPCTLNHLGNKSIPQIPRKADRQEQFKSEIGQAAEEGLKRLEALEKTVEGLKISQKAKDEILSKTRMVAATFTSNMPFIAKSFDEHMEETVEKAKIEVNAYVQSALVRTGLAALGGESPIKALTGDVIDVDREGSEGTPGTDKKVP